MMLEGLSSSFGFIFLSEIGDKTFIFIAVYATKIYWPKMMLIACAAMFGMHLSSVLIGSAFQFVIDHYYLHILCSTMFFVFGALILRDAITEDEEEDADEKFEETEKEIRENEKKTKAKSKDASGLWSLIVAVLTSHAIRIILMIVAEEMGDRSQITAVTLAATYDFWIVTFGGFLGHFVAICIAISAGKLIAYYLSEKLMNYVGGFCFIGFGVYGYYSLYYW